MARATTTPLVRHSSFGLATRICVERFLYPENRLMVSFPRKELVIFGASVLVLEPV
jgi:hypothetical protein